MVLWMGTGGQISFPKTCFTYPTITKLGIVIPYLKKFLHISLYFSIAKFSVCLKKNKNRAFASAKGYSDRFKLMFSDSTIAKG